MPSVYLSPSTQAFNEYITGGNEEYWMNRIVDNMIPFLKSSGIEYTRNHSGESVTEIIEESNLQPYNLHLALQSSKTPPDNPEPLRGIRIYHYAISPVNGDKAAYIFAENLKMIYPNPELVTVIPDFTQRELSLSNAPAVLVDLGYHDNEQDASWITNSIEEIGENLALSVAQFCKVPFVEAPPF